MSGGGWVEQTQGFETNTQRHGEGKGKGKGGLEIGSSACCLVGSES